MRKKLLSRPTCAQLAQSAFARVTIFISIIVLFSQTSYAQARLVRDIADWEDYWTFEYTHLLDGNGTFYFVESNQLWKSDGTVSGTTKIMAFDHVASPLWADGSLYFIADDGLTGRELWKTDGTSEGTFLVKDIQPGPVGSDPRELTSVNGALYFAANDGVHGVEIWKTNGTETGTMLVKDIMRVKGSSNPSGLTALGGTLFFSANDAEHSYELWKTDGTASGTMLVKDLWPGHSSAPHSFVRVNDRLFFVAANVEGKELWITDGTSGGTHMVRALRGGSGSPGIDNMTAVNNTLFFTAHDGVHGHELWRSDGTHEGTNLVKDMTPGLAGSHGEGPFTSQMNGFTNINGTLFFAAYQNDQFYIWKSDGTDAGTIPLHPAAGPGLADARPQFTYMNGGIYYFNETDEPHSEDYYLYRMNEDGSSPEIIRQLNYVDYYNPYYPKIVRVGDYLYIAGQISGGTTLIKSDGTRDGTMEFIDVRDGTLDSDPDNFVFFNGNVYFDVVGWQDWFPGSYDPGGLMRTDGTASGTQNELTDLEGTMSVAAADALYIAALKESRYGVWKIDLQDKHSQLVEFDRGKVISGVILAGGLLYFHTADAELWRSDGTPEGTFALMHTYRINSLTPTARGLMVQATSANGDEELWKSAGTAATTAKVKTIRHGWGTASRYYPTAVIDDILFFVANDGVHGNELWRSDGTNAGTYMAVNINGNDRVESDNKEYDISSMAVFQDELYFGALQIVSGVASWSLRTYRDGEMSTGVLEANHPAVQLIPVAGHLFLVAGKSGSSHELWSYYPHSPLRLLAPLDGDYNEGFDHESVNGVMYYSTKGGADLWRSDGTPCGTFSIELGSEGAHEMALLGNSLIFASTQPEFGTELYSFDLSLDPGNPCEPGSVACSASGVITWEYWDGVEGSRVSDIPVNEDPTETAEVTMFEGPANIGIHYGTRIRGYICPPLSGDYRFYLSSNDHSELWLSDSEDAASRVMIAEVRGATGVREWNKFASQQSVSIPLLKGKKYYIEALHKQGVGTDHIAVAWVLPDGAFEEPIAGRHLSPFEPDAALLEESSARTAFTELYVYPNPAVSGEPLLTLSGYEQISDLVRTDIRIINMTGEVVFSEQIHCGGDCHSYLLRMKKSLAPGIYLVSLKSGEQRSSKRLLVK